VAASEIQNLKNSLNFSKMQKIATKISRLFLVRSASFFQKQRFS
jgi:flagellin-specific chaperone FliS